MLRAGLMRTLSPPIRQILPLSSNNSVSNKPTLRYRSTRASQKRKIVKEDPAPLLVSIKGLSEEEENYVRRQTQLCLTSQPVPVQGRQEELNKLYKKAGVKVRHANLRCPTIVSRCLAMADSFNVDKKDRAAFLAFCNQHAEPSTHRRQFHLFDPNPIHRGLLHYSLSPGKKAFKDWEAHANMPDFKTKYKEKLNSVIENLGLLEFEEFPEELNENSSFAEFSTNFYRRILLENCGISDLENLAKKRRKLLDLHNSAVIRDPVNIVRNYFIFSEILNVDLDTNLPSLAHLTHTSSLDLLSTLNVLQQSLDGSIDQDTEEEETFSSPSMLHTCLDDQRLAALPLGLNLRLLHVIGFTQQEIKKLLFHPEMSNKLSKSVLIDFNQIVGEKFGGDVEAFCETFRRRLEIIRSEAGNLGIKDTFEIYKFLVNWEEAMAALDRAAQEHTDVPLLLRFEDTSSEFRNSCRVSLPSSSNVPLRNGPSSSVAKGQGCEAYLKKLFSLYRSNGERTKAFKASLKRVPHHKEVPAAVVREASCWLQEKEEFTLKQLEMGFPTLLYAVPVLEAALDKADDQLEEGWRSREDALCLLNYFVELESSFKFTSIYEGVGSMIKEHNRLNSSDAFEEEWEDTETRRGQDFDDWDEDLDEDHEELDDCTSPAFQQQASRRNFLAPTTSSSINMLASPFSTSSVSFSDEKKEKSKIRIKVASSKVRKDEAFKLDEKLPGLNLKPGQVKVWQPQNPLTRLKVWLKFKEIQATWDPSIDQTEFVAGARQAVLMIASTLSTGGQWGQLRGLLHRKEHKRLQQVVEKQWTDVERRRLEIEEEHLLLLQITDCRLQQINQFKYLDVYVYAMALSPLGDNFVKMNVTFHREYTEGQLPDWIVTKFEVI